MSLLPPRFQEHFSCMPLGPVVKPEAKPFEPHVHDWRPSASSKDHVVCSCGHVSLREFVMPPEVKLADDGQDVDWAGCNAAAGAVVIGIDPGSCAPKEHGGFLHSGYVVDPARLQEREFDLKPWSIPVQRAEARQAEIAALVRAMEAQLNLVANPPLTSAGVPFRPVHTDSVWELFRREEQAKQNERARKAAIEARYVKALDNPAPGAQPNKTATEVLMKQEAAVSRFAHANWQVSPFTAPDPFARYRK